MTISFPLKNSLSRKKSFSYSQEGNPPFLSFLYIIPKQSLLLLLLPQSNFIQSPHWFHPQNRIPALPNLAARGPFSPGRTRRSGSRGKGRTSLRSRRIRQLVRSPDVCRRLFFFSNKKKDLAPCC